MKNTLIAITALIAATLSSAANSFDAEVTGSGNPILLIPGLSCDGSVWEETVARYSDRYECHAISIKGFGANNSGSNEEAFLNTVTSDLANYIVENELKSPVIVGHSLGGVLALKLSLEHAELVQSLLIVDSLPFLPAAMNPTATSESMKEAANTNRNQSQQGGMSREQAKYMLQTMVTAPENIERAVDMSLASDGSTVGAAMYDLNTTDLRENMANIKTPTVVLGAWIAYQQYGSTKESTAAIFDAQYAKHPNYQLAMSDKGKHFIMWDDPNFFYSHLDSILAK